MLWCAFSFFLFVHASADVTFNHVTIMGGSKPVNIISSNTLSHYVPERTITEIHFKTEDVIPVLYTDSIADLDHLEVLDLASHGVREVRRGAFNNLPKLNDLNLDLNRLEEITSGVFNHVQNLTTLRLNGNRIRQVSRMAFERLQNLSFLFLAGNRLTTFDADWFNDKPLLAVVDLNENLIEEIPDGAFEDYQQAIFLGNNLIRNLSRGMFGEGRSLRQLSLHDNEIEGWDEDFLEDVYLGSFDVANNRIECLTGNLTDIFAAKYTTLVDNPWDCECLEKIVDFKEWAEEKFEISIDLGNSWDDCNLVEDN